MIKNHDFKKLSITYTLACLLIFNTFFGNTKKKTEEIKYVASSIEDYSPNDLKELIYESNDLTLEEKEYLYNEEFISDILPIVNESLANRIKYQKNLSNLKINNYIDGEHNDIFAGYYTTSYPNEIFIKDYEDFDENKDTLAHEFIHMFQDLSGYNFITEACAEIISYEYYPETKVTCYTTQVKILKKLMEIIGSDVIWNYNFTGDFKPIEEKIKPYLTTEEYNDFIECLSFDYTKHEDNKIKFNRLNELLSILYENIYNKDINDNNIFYLIDNEKSLERYYFNKRLINEEKSYYIDRVNKEFRRISYSDAINNNYFLAYSIKYIDLTQEEARELINEEKYSLVRKINYSKNNIMLKRRTEKGFHTYITGTIDGIIYEEADVDELAKNNIISVTYQLASLKKLTAEEYLNRECEEGAEIFEMYSKNDMKLYSDHIEGYFPTKVFIDPFNNNEIDNTLKLKDTNN